MNYGTNLNETSYNVPNSIEEAREGLKHAKSMFERSPTYETAKGLQICQRFFDKFVEESRKSFFTFDGSKGIHNLTPEEIMVSALKEILSRGQELQEAYKGLPQAPTTYVDYFKSVAKQALIDTGNNTLYEEISTIPEYNLNTTVVNNV